MSTTETINLPPDRRTLRNVRVLCVAQMILGSQMPVNFIIGGLAGQVLSPLKCWSTMPITMIVLGSMLTAPMISQIMQKFGRRTGFYIGITGGATGSVLNAVALLIGSFPLLLFGSFLSGIYMSAQGFYRFAAADGTSGPFRAKAISWVMAAGLAAAIIGPQLVKLTTDALAPVPFAGAYFAAAALNVAGIVIFLFLESPSTESTSTEEKPGRSYIELLQTPRILVAMICGMVSYALMNLVMTSTPLAIVGCGYGTAEAADVVGAHVVAMFLPAFFTGNLINRFGVERIISAGLIILAVSGIVGLSGVDITNFYGALILLGIGWNFGYIGATTMLTEAHLPEERGRVQGMNDFFVFGFVAIASLSSGILMNCSGGDAQSGWQAVNLAMIPMLALAGGALVWLTLLRRPA